MRTVPLSRPIAQGEDPETGLATFGFEVDDMFVTDPFKSSCGRFEVNPTETWGLSLEESRWLLDLNEAVVAATEAAVNAACKEVQDRLGIESGDYAGLFYAEKANHIGHSKSVADYLQFELKNAGVAVTD